MLLHTLTPLAEPAVPAISAITSIYPTPSTTSHSYPALIPATEDHDFLLYRDQLENPVLILGPQVLGLASPSETWQGAQFGLGATARASQVPLCYYLVGALNADKQKQVFQTCLTGKMTTLIKLQLSYVEGPLHLKPAWQQPQLNWYPSKGRRPLLEHYLLQ